MARLGRARHFPPIIKTANLNVSPYSREAIATLPTSNAVLSIQYSPTEISNVSSVDSVFVDVAGLGYIIHQFKNYNTNSTSNITATWEGQTTIAPSASTVYLQVYNQNTASWETLTSNNSAAANSTFTLTASITASVGNYYDAQHGVTFRVYQHN